MISGELGDEALVPLLLGMWAAVAVDPERFPLYVDHVEPMRGEDGQVYAFDLITRSGLRLRTTVELVS